MILRDILRVSYGSRSASKICTTGFRTFSCSSWTCTSRSISLQSWRTVRDEGQGYRRLWGVIFLTAWHGSACGIMQGAGGRPRLVELAFNKACNRSRDFSFLKHSLQSLLGEITDITSHFRIDDTRPTALVHQMKFPRSRYRLPSLWTTSSTTQHAIPPQNSLSITSKLGDTQANNLSKPSTSVFGQAKHLSCSRHISLSAALPSISTSCRDDQNELPTEQKMKQK